MSVPVLAKAVLEAHRRLDRHLPSGLFGDPALLMLLDLFLAETGPRELSVGACCAVAGVPHTTALRWLRTLEDKRLVERRPHPSDGRSSMVRIAPRGRAALIAWLAEFGGSLATRTEPPAVPAAR